MILVTVYRDCLEMIIVEVKTKIIFINWSVGGLYNSLDK